MALNNSQYESIMRIYDRRQALGREELQEHQEWAYRRLPRLEELDREISSLAVRQARRLLEGDQGAVESLKKEAERISAERIAILREAGLPDDYLEQRYECPWCRDTGYVEGKKCRCFLQKELELLYHQSRIRERLKTENFDSCTDMCYSDTEIVEGTSETARSYMNRVIQECRRYAAEFDRKGGNLVLYGSTGVGKTFLAGCIARELIETYHSVVYLSAADLFDSMAKDRFRRDEEDGEDGSTQSILDCDLLIIDDLGTEMINSWTNSQLFYCLNKRLLSGKSTIITTNLTPNQLSREYSDRVGSRLVESFRFLAFPPGDVRIWKRIQESRRDRG